MSEPGRTLNGVAETLLIPLYVRGIESQRPDALLKDEAAVALVERAKADFAFIDALKLDEGDRVTLILRNREFDRHVRRFMAQHPRAPVVHIGCGLDARFDRVDDGQVEWYDLDLPEVIALRKELVRGEGPRYHLLASSVFDKEWLDVVRKGSSLPVLFMAEGVLMYFDEARVRSVVLTLLDPFPGSELILIEHHWRAYLLKQVGVPTEAIVADMASTNSDEEAALGLRLARERGWKTVLVLSDPPHMRRLSLIWGRVFEGSGIQLHLVPSRPKWWIPDRWWTSRKSAKFLISEYIKLVYTLL